MSNEENGHDGDNEQDGLSFPSSPSVCSPCPEDSDAHKAKISLSSVSPSPQAIPASVPSIPPQPPAIVAQQMPVSGSLLPVNSPIQSGVVQEMTPSQEEHPLPEVLACRPLPLASARVSPLPVSPPPPMPSEPIKSEEPVSLMSCSNYPMASPPPPPNHPLGLVHLPQSRSPSPAPAHQITPHHGIPLVQSLPPVHSPVAYQNKHHPVISGMSHCSPGMPPPAPQNLSYSSGSQPPQRHQSPRLTSPIGFGPLEPPPAHSSHPHHVHPYLSLPRVSIPEVMVPPTSQGPQSSTRASPIVGVPLSVSVSPLQMSPQGIGTPHSAMQLPLSSAPSLPIPPPNSVVQPSSVMELPPPPPEPEIEPEEVEDHVVPGRGPSPEPRIEDSECHRSQSAMYVNSSNVLHISFKA